MYVAVVVESATVSYSYNTTLSMPWCIESMLSTVGGLIKVVVGICRYLTALDSTALSIPWRIECMLHRI